VLYLLGPVGGGKSSLAERLKLLMEKEPIYVLKAGDEISPIFESPLGLFDPNDDGRRSSRSATASRGGA
jgi:serine protein kinase